MEKDTNQGVVADRPFMAKFTQMFRTQPVLQEVAIAFRWFGKILNRNEDGTNDCLWQVICQLTESLDGIAFQVPHFTRRSIRQRCIALRDGHCLWSYTLVELFEFYNISLRYDGTALNFRVWRRLRRTTLKRFYALLQIIHLRDRFSERRHLCRLQIAVLWIQKRVTESARLACHKLWATNSSGKRLNIDPDTRERDG